MVKSCQSFFIGEPLKFSLASVVSPVTKHPPCARTTRPSSNKVPISVLNFWRSAAERDISGTLRHSTGNQCNGEIVVKYKVIFQPTTMPNGYNGIIHMISFWKKHLQFTNTKSGTCIPEEERWYVYIYITDVYTTNNWDVLWLPRIC